MRCHISCPPKSLLISVKNSGLPKGESDVNDVRATIHGALVGRAIFTRYHGLTGCRFTTGSQVGAAPTLNGFNHS